MRSIRSGSFKFVLHSHLIRRFAPSFSVETDGEKLQVGYVFRVETEDNVDENTRTDVFYLATGEREE